MELELVTIGNELLLGFTLNTNAAELARALAEAGVRVARHTTVGDDPAAIEAAVRQGLQRSGFVITSGGLGPTRDDVTKRSVAEIFDARLELDRGYLKELERRFKGFGIGRMPESNRSQAEVPRGATVLRNPWGTAPGLWLEGPLGGVIMLPGVPRELRGLLEAEVVPRLQTRAGERSGRVTRSRVLRTTGRSESALADTLEGVADRIAPLTLAFLPSPEGVDLRLTAWQMGQQEAIAALAAGVDTILPSLGACYYGEGDIDLAALVIDLLARKGPRLAVAESCTGGMIGQRITAIPGASAVFVGGVVAYSNAVKASALGVPEALVEEHGAVSEAVARAMATGVAERLGAEASIAVTGVAGPEGGTPQKPVGSVWLAARLNGREKVRGRVFPGSRGDVRLRAAQAGLDLLRRLLVERNGPESGEQP
jgi:nicotinamide-nucleotide amidase